MTGRKSGQDGTWEPPQPASNEIASAELAARLVASRQRIEDDGPRPPQDHAGLVAFARSLSSPALAELLEDAEPLGETRTLRFPSSLRRRYDELRDFPSGLAVCADALSSRLEVHRQSGIELAREAGAVITNAETVIFDLLHVAGTDEFRRVAPLVK